MSADTLEPSRIKKESGYHASSNWHTAERRGDSWSSAESAPIKIHPIDLNLIKEVESETGHLEYGWDGDETGINRRLAGLRRNGESQEPNITEERTR